MTYDEAVEYWKALGLWASQTGIKDIRLIPLPGGFTARLAFFAETFACTRVPPLTEADAAILGCETIYSVEMWREATRC
jgi:hypothetical protein